MKPHLDKLEGEADLNSVIEYLASPSPDSADVEAINRLDDEPGIPSGYLERSSETRRSPVPRARRGA